MIVETKSEDIFRGNEKHIVFGINSEGINDSGFAGFVSRRYWKELAYIGPHKLGTVLSKKVSNNLTLHAIVCHSLMDGWNNQIEVIRDCFNNIPCNKETVATIAIGTGFVGKMLNADFDKIKIGMQLSDTKIVLYM